MATWKENNSINRFKSHPTKRFKEAQKLSYKLEDGKVLNFYSDENFPASVNSLPYRNELELYERIFLSISLRFYKVYDIDGNYEVNENVFSIKNIWSPKGLYPSNDLYPSEDLYPDLKSFNYLILKFKLFQKVAEDDATYEDVINDRKLVIKDTGAQYLQAIPLEKRGNVDLI